VFEPTQNTEELRSGSKKGDGDMVNVKELFS